MHADPDTHPYQGGPAMPSPPTLRGVLLEPGERVVYFHASKNIGTRVLLLVVGLALVPIVIGLLFIWGALTDQSDTRAVTNKRYIRIQKNKAEVMALRDVVRFETRHSKRWMSDVVLFDAAGRRFEMRVMDDDALRDLVLALARDPMVAEQAPPVPYDA